MLLARLSARPDSHRVTVHPCGASALAPPDRIAATVGMHRIGNLAPDDRRALFTALVPRLAPGAPMVLNVQPPDTAVEVPQGPPRAVDVGRQRYEGRGHAVPAGPARLRWRMTYSTLDGDNGDAEISREVSEYLLWTVSAATLNAELTDAGAASVTVDGDLVIARG